MVRVGEQKDFVFISGIVNRHLFAKFAGSNSLPDSFMWTSVMLIYSPPVNSGIMSRDSASGGQSAMQNIRAVAENTYQHYFHGFTQIAT
jgi:hypothetical protein